MFSNRVGYGQVPELSYSHYLLHTIFIFYHREFRQLLEKCAATALSSKLVAAHKDYFARMVVDAVQILDDLMPLNMIGIKKVQGGGLEVSISQQSM